jgi:hypothetical protein
MCCVYRDCIRLLTVIKRYWWVTVPGAVRHRQLPTEERGSWNWCATLHTDHHSLWQGVCYRHADCYGVWKFKMKGLFITVILHCMTTCYHNCTLHDTMLPLFVTEFHNCSFLSVCDNTWGTTICVLNVYSVTSRGTWHAHASHFLLFLISFLLHDLLNIYFGHPNVT